MLLLCPALCSSNPPAPHCPSAPCSTTAQQQAPPTYDHYAPHTTRRGGPTPPLAGPLPLLRPHCAGWRGGAALVGPRRLLPRPLSSLLSSSTKQLPYHDPPKKAFGPSLPRRAPLLLLFSSTRVGTHATQRLLLILLFFALLFCSLPAVWSPSCPALPSRCCPPDASRPFFLTPSFPQSFKRNPPCLPAFQILLFFCHPPYHQQPLQQTHNNTHNNTQQTRYYTSHLHKHYQTASPPFPPKSPGPHAPPATTTIVIITDGQCLTLGEFP